jgi:hypothetical protein
LILNLPQPRTSDQQERENPASSGDRLAGIAS